MSKLIMTFDEYIKNPSGRGSAVNPTRESSESMYQAKLNDTISKNGDIKYTCLKSSDALTVSMLVRKSELSITTSKTPWEIAS